MNDLPPVGVRDGKAINFNIFQPNFYSNLSCFLSYLSEIPLYSDWELFFFHSPVKPSAVFWLGHISQAAFSSRR